ncbi:MAG: cupin domain-containing protein [Planctomycetia bacterium]|nr:cupin domain-containing protein [Planctomycetia bacterium]
MNAIDTSNLFANAAASSSAEVCEQLLAGGSFRLERIISTGQTTPEGQWYDQDADEWVLLLCGAARLRFEGPDQSVELKPGDYINIPAHRRHRVEWTDPGQSTVWLGLHHFTGSA